MPSRGRSTPSVNDGPQAEKLDQVDAKVDDLTVQVAVIDTRQKIGFAVLGALIASPKVGGPSVSQVGAAVIHLFT